MYAALVFKLPFKPLLPHCKHGLNKYSTLGGLRKDELAELGQTLIYNFILLLMISTGNPFIHAVASTTKRQSI